MTKEQQDHFVERLGGLRERGRAVCRIRHSEALRAYDEDLEGIDAKITALKDRILAGNLSGKIGSVALSELQSLENDLLKP